MSDDAAEAAPQPPKHRKKKRVWPLIVAGLYAVATLSFIVLLRAFVDRFWLATAIAFAPRWGLALAAPIPIAAAAIGRDLRAGAVVAATLALQLIFVADLHVSLGHGAAPKDRALRVMTQNADSVPFSTGWVESVVKANDLDLLVVQECPISSHVDTPSPLDGYAFEKDINTCVISRWPITKSDPRPRRDAWARGGSGAIALYEIEAPFGTFALLNVHFATARHGLNGFRQFGLGGIATTKENIDLRRWESEVAREWTHRTSAPLIVAGDFNMPAESAIYRSTWGELTNAFDACGSGFGYSKETVLHGVEYGTRIDHVAYDGHWKCHAARLGPEMGSDHRGIFAELSLE